MVKRLQCAMLGAFTVNDVFLALKIVFILTNSAGPDEMQLNAAFHLGLHCMQKYMFTGSEIEKC